MLLLGTIPDQHTSLAGMDLQGRSSMRHDGQITFPRRLESAEGGQKRVGIDIATDGASLGTDQGADLGKAAIQREGHCPLRDQGTAGVGVAGRAEGVVAPVGVVAAPVALVGTGAPLAEL